MYGQNEFHIAPCLDCAVACQKCTETTCDSVLNPGCALEP